MAMLYLLTPLSINPELFQNVLLQSQTPHGSIPKEIPLIGRQWSKMLWLSETGSSRELAQPLRSREILLLAGFQQQCSQAFVLSTS